MTMQVESVHSVALELTKLDDVKVCDYVEAAEEELSRIQTILKEHIDAGKAELERRIRERNAKSILHPRMLIELVEQYSGYAYDIEALKTAASELPEDERAKVIKYIPEQVTIVPEHFEPGNPRSITALRERYAGTKAADLLTQAMTRDSLGSKLVIKPRK